MKKYLIAFKEMEWETPAPGVRQKVYTKGEQKIRLVEFTEQFVEEGWCAKGHTGYVIEGRLSIDFSGRLLTFREGDGLFIPEGEKNKHKAKVVEGEKALMILFEPNE